MKYSVRQNIGASLSDSQAQLSILGLFQITEDAVCGLMGSMGLDNASMKRKNGAVWVFTKSKVRSIQPLPWGAEAQVEAFLSAATNGTLQADVALRDAQGQLCAYGRVELCALDLQTGRIRRISTIEGVDTEVCPPETDLAFTRAAKAEALQPCGQVQVQYTHIDFLRHTNNVAYIAFLLNTYFVEQLERRPIREMQIAYRSQTYEGDLLHLYKAEGEERDALCIQKEGAVVTTAEIFF